MAEEDKGKEGCSSDGGKYVTIATVESSIEAAIAEGALKQAGVPVMIRSFHDSAYDGLFAFQKGFGRVIVPVRYAEEAAVIVRQALEIKSDESEENRDP